MGMYTKLWFDADLKHNVDEINLRALEYLFVGGDVPDVLPCHPFFTLERWSYMFYSPAYSGDAVTVKLGDYYNHVSAHIEVKNYCGEIESFLDWVRPLLDVEKGTCIGWKWYEGDDNPILIYA
ncbi:hypothetical protein SGPC_00026 [Salmonella phage SGPC]|uniref:Uncharacterized protein n=1 Tax=Salmonella phage SETP13 TaxID=424949 RepID=U5N3W8_9CAUD|nr:hypothetical protein V186_gp04 [Salmonella phage SETP13]YP_010748534.1 hypothetical protein QA064_gp26 [Salmonella phage SGPC]AGX84608.1 hypothetical protein [Salmonella phage SETP13]UCR75452.1 hypothetical protein SGPC_00026 [Salmonella phage SGPC]